MSTRQMRHVLVVGMLGVGLSAAAFAGSGNDARSAADPAANALAQAAAPGIPQRAGALAEGHRSQWAKRVEAMRARHESRRQALRERLPGCRTGAGGGTGGATARGFTGPAARPAPPMPMDPIGRALIQLMELGRPDFAAGDTRGRDAEIERRREALTARRHAAHPWSQARRDWQEARREDLLQRFRGPGHAHGPWRAVAPAWGAPPRPQGYGSGE